MDCDEADNACILNGRGTMNAGGTNPNRLCRDGEDGDTSYLGLGRTPGLRLVPAHSPLP
jgi:hypothetical protein